VKVFESDAPETGALVTEIDHFNARGMRRVYGRGDHFDRHRSFNMDIWRTHDGRLLMRCWSRCEDIDWCSFKIKGVDLAEIPEINKSAGFQDSWVPSAARQAYERWIDEEF
jgi:hypothetical protein